MPIVTYTSMKGKMLQTNREFKELSAEDLMLIYQRKSPELAFRAFDELYCRFSQKLFSYLQKKCKNQADAEDLLQKVFIKMHEHKHLYNDKYKLEQWLFVIARTSVLDHFRFSKRYTNRLTKLEAELLPEEREKEIDVFLSLDQDQKEMLEMKYIDELTYQEMAVHFNKSEGALRKIVSRMVINLRKGEV